jgi:hypothetical protein
LFAIYSVYETFLLTIMAKDIGKIKEKYESTLLSYPNVTGVAVGLRQKNGTYTKDKCIIVFVRKKIPRRHLKPDERIPTPLDGIYVDVQESGDYRAY